MTHLRYPAKELSMGLGLGVPPGYLAPPGPWTRKNRPFIRSLLLLEVSPKWNSLVCHMFLPFGLASRAHRPTQGLEQLTQWPLGPLPTDTLWLQVSESSLAE